MNVDNFQKLLEPTTDFALSRTVSSSLGEELNRRFSPDSEIFNAIEAACHEAILAAGGVHRVQKGGASDGSLNRVKRLQYLASM